ncbi:MAG: hypothetical protein M3167_11285 [Acidobacteriota bacterium]|nr:hypothetical protein [Acidobacteriota bacterium]
MHEENPAKRLSCDCGLSIEEPRDAVDHGCRVEVACRCGRRLDLERVAGRWMVRGELVPEGSVPLEGFSRALRLREDTQRFWFHEVDRAGRRSNVHVVFSPSDRVAEVKRGDVRALRLSNVASPTEARRRWLEWMGGSSTA